MMAETIRLPEHRGKAVGTVQSSWSFGWGAAAILYWAFFALLPEQVAWRACFWIGILPALDPVHPPQRQRSGHLHGHPPRATKAACRATSSRSSPPHLRATLFGSALHRDARRLLRDHDVAAHLPENRPPPVGVQHERLSRRADRRLVRRLRGRRDPVRPARPPRVVHPVRDRLVLARHGVHDAADHRHRDAAARLPARHRRAGDLRGRRRLSVGAVSGRDPRLGQASATTSGAPARSSRFSLARCRSRCRS